MLKLKMVYQKMQRYIDKQLSVLLSVYLLQSMDLSKKRAHKPSFLTISQGSGCQGRPSMRDVDLR